MDTLIELAPLAAFFVAWGLGGIYAATAVLMVAMLLLIGWDWFRKRAIPKMHLISAVMVWVFGAATLLLHDVRFIQWKATVFYWLLALVLVGSLWIGRVTLLERLMGQALPQDHTVRSSTWRNLSLISAAFYLLLGAVNLWVAYHMSEKAWVLFKSWLTIPLLLVFNAGLVFWLLRGYSPPEPNPKEPS